MNLSKKIGLMDIGAKNSVLITMAINIRLSLSL